MSSRLSETEREVLRLKITQSGADAVILYVERLLAQRTVALAARAEKAEATVERVAGRVEMGDGIEGVRAALLPRLGEPATESAEQAPTTGGTR
jgi:hypothetical protein